MFEQRGVFMKRTVVMMMLMITAAFSAFAQKQDEAKPDEKIVRQLKQFEGNWLTASLNQDNAWLERFFAGKFVVVPFENDAVKNRAREMAEMIDPKLKPDEMKVRITGNVTVLTNGGNRSYYFLDTFNQRGGKWQVIATHFSRIPEPTSMEQTVMQMEREWSNAIIKKDIAGLKRIIADDFAGVESSGRVVNKAQTISEIESGSDDVQSETAEDLKVRVYGDTAIVTGRLLVNGEKNEAGYNLKLLFTKVWAKRDGQWQVVNYQATQIK